MANKKTRNAQKKSDAGKTPPGRREASKNKEAKHISADK